MTTLVEHFLLLVLFVWFVDVFVSFVLVSFSLRHVLLVCIVVIGCIVCIACNLYGVVVVDCLWLNSLALCYAPPK